VTTLVAALAASALLGILFAVPRQRAGGPRRAREDSTADIPDRAVLLRLRPVLVTVALPAGWVILGGAAGIIAGLLLSAVSWRVLGEVESPSVRRRRELLARQLPCGVQLLATALRAGADIESAMALVALALPGPFAEEITVLGRRLRLGVPPAQVWTAVPLDSDLGPLARTLGRAQETGASVAQVMDALAVELQGRRRGEVERAAKSVDVRASAPLGICFLPAFMVLGVAPLVAGVFGTLQFLR